MATWFDKDRGVLSGRLQPRTITSPDGNYVFVLGAEALAELAKVTENDYSEVRQTVDLTGYDLIGATFDTVGTAMGQYQPFAGFAEDDDLIFGFDFNVGSGQSDNMAQGGFALAMDGGIVSGKETYSPNETYCRHIPIGVGLARMLGSNTPQAFPSALPEWTFQWWMNFDSSAHPVSTGINAIIFQAKSALPNGGLAIKLAGIAGIHEWELRVEHTGSGVLENVTIDSFSFDAPQGWNLYTLRYKETNSAPEQLELFVNDALVGQASIPFTVSPAQPLAGEAIIYGDAALVGYIDDMRLLARHLTDSEIQESYLGCTVNPAPRNYKWVMQLLIDDQVYGTRVIATSEQRRWTDFYVPCRLLTGPHDVAFRLAIEAA